MSASDPGGSIQNAAPRAANGPFRVGIGGPVGSGKTALTLALCRALREKYDLAVVTNEFADKYADAVTTWVEQQDKAVKLFRDDPDAYAAALAAELNIDADEALAQAKDLIFLTADEQTGADYLGGGLAENLIASAKFNKDQGKIDAVQPDDVYEKAVNATFAAKAG